MDWMDAFLTFCVEIFPFVYSKAECSVHFDRTKTFSTLNLCSKMVNFPFQNTFCTTYFTNIPFFFLSSLLTFLQIHLCFDKGKQYRSKLRRAVSNVIPSKRKAYNNQIYEDIQEIITEACLSQIGEPLPNDINSIIFEYLPLPNDINTVTYWRAFIGEVVQTFEKKILFWQGFVTVYYHIQAVYLVVLTGLIWTVLLFFCVWTVQCTVHSHARTILAPHTKKSCFVTHVPWEGKWSSEPLFHIQKRK